MTRVSLEYFLKFFFSAQSFIKPYWKEDNHDCRLTHLHDSLEQPGKKDNEYSFTTWVLIHQQSKNLNGIQILRLD